METNKVPPQSLELESSVLGSLLMEPGRLNDVADLLTPEMFYKPANAMIYDAIIHLANRNQPYDLSTVTERLQSNGNLTKIQDGAYYITCLCDNYNGLSVEQHARILVEKFILREMIHTFSDVVREAFSESSDVFELLEKTENNLIAISGKLIKSSGQSIAALVSTEINELKARMNSKNALIGIGSGYPEIDRITNGWQKQTLTIIAARPGMGKTAFGLIAARNAAIDFGVPTAFFSLEMSSSQLVQRLFAAESGVSFKSIQSGKCQTEFEIIYKAAGKLSNTSIFIDETASISIFDLRSKARQLKMKHDIGLVVVDYLQLMQGEKNRRQTREQEVTSISHGLKALSKELNIPVIALAQLNRANESRGDKRPFLSDLRESGSIEQDADIVAFLHRPSYYKETYNGEPIPENILELSIAKHRNGATTFNPIILNFNPEIMKITSLEKQDYQPF